MVLVVASLRADATRLLLMRGQFDEQDALHVSKIWLILTCGLLPIAEGIFISKYLQAIKRPWTITSLAVVSVSSILALALAWLLVESFGVPGLAAASGISYTIVALAFHIQLEKNLGTSLIKPQFLSVIAMLVIALLGRAAIVALAPMMTVLSLPMRLAATGFLLILISAALLSKSGLVNRKVLA